MHFVPEDAARSSYRGYVRVEDDELAVRVSNVTYDARTGRALLVAAQLDVERALAERLKPHGATLKLRLAQASSLAGFATELEELVAICCRSQTGNRVALPGASYYARLIAEMDVVGWNRLRHLSDDLRSLELETKDKAGRTHTVRVRLPLQYETTGFAVKPECLVDAPEPFEVHWTREHPTVLDQVLKQFESFLDTYQPFWDVLDGLDAATCVLEPQHPTRATGRRRLALGRHASVQFEVDPAHPAAMLCELSFFGNQTSVGALRERWGNDAANKWDEKRSLHKNLEDVLQVSLPSPKTTKAEEFAVECGICYSYRLEDERNNEKVKEDAGAMQRKPIEQASRIPDQLCENANCNRPFHAKCLFDWIRALPTSRQSFHTVFGECPYCREAISAKFHPEF
ncbi:E3 ubiquitin-protein ligase [Phytophthora megakarya]|uniref:E3 ubiquitin-protein ligase n=1 Tax=Phytophthora megakarya TaxID=4795 RepID=A0A225WVB5_9STRA|nr:E3 ubiquitin-protein ligase [Phytophthora megakarya]